MSALPYFTVAKMLDTDPRLARLSVEAKYLYSRMRDTLKLSIKNNWRDKLGPYIKMTRENMAQLLHKSLPTVRKILKELVEAKLIIDIRMGLTRCNRIYVRLLPGEGESDLVPAKQDERVHRARNENRLPSGEEKISHSGEKVDFIPDRNNLSPSKRNQSNPNPNENKNKWDHFWVLQEGSIFKYRNSFWIYEDHEITPYLFGEELESRANELLLQMSMAY
ncbi:replication initiator protein A [Eubacteriales bacterium OttesenSCG-928-A19]|nr:replication initiator protein A [Eubacteriales bacterium OttesenSCG-928-A19]